MSHYAKANDQYLTQRVMGASPEQLVVLLLEGGQRFLLQATQAISKRDIATKAHAINRVTAIVEELAVGLNHEAGGELVDNLTRLYDWWAREVFEAGAAMDAARLDRVSRQMGDMKQSWDQAYQKRVGSSGGAGFQAGNLVG